MRCRQFLLMASKTCFTSSHVSLWPRIQVQGFLKRSCWLSVFQLNWEPQVVFAAPSRGSYLNGSELQIAGLAAFQFTRLLSVLCVVAGKSRGALCVSLERATWLSMKPPTRELTGVVWQSCLFHSSLPHDLSEVTLTWGKYFCLTGCSKQMHYKLISSLMFKRLCPVHFMTD